jgi:ATP adenylyltransferase
MSEAESTEAKLLKQLWAPWRLAYVAAAKPPTEQNSCFICNGLADSDDRKHLIALRTPLSAVVLNKFPYNSGHLLVAPRAHKGQLAELTTEEVLDIQRALRRMVETLDEMLHPDGYNIGVNLGRAAGAGLPGHLHWHIVPRWVGDTNFMPVLGDAKVMVQSLDALYELLTRKVQSANSDAG